MSFLGLWTEPTQRGATAMRLWAYLLCLSLALWAPLAQASSPLVQAEAPLLS